MISRTVVIILFCLIPVCIINGQSGDFATIEIFTSEDIREAGLVNLNDITLLSNNIEKTSINGYSGNIVFNGLSTFQNQDVIVLINGQQIDVAFLGDFNLDVLPFNIDQVDSVIIVSSPMYYKNYLSRSGLIEFIIKKETAGFSLNAFQSIGNEIGDPGPFAYTPYRTPNVDKLGFLAGMSISTSGTDWNLVSNIKLNENFVTDQAIRPRINELSAESKARILGANAILSYNFLNGSHQFIFNFSENSDFVYFPLFGNEIPNKRVHRHIGFNGEIPINKKLKLSYNITNGINEFAKSENSRDLNFNLKVNSTLLGLGLAYTGLRIKGSMGMEYRKYDANRSGFNNDEQLEFMRSYFDVGFKVIGNIFQHTGIQLTKNQSNNGFVGYTKTIWNLNNYNSLQLNTAYSSTWINQELNYYSWAISGFTVFNEDETIYNPSFFYRPKKTLSIDLAYRFSSPKTVIGGNIFYRRHKDFYLDNTIYNLPQDENLFDALEGIEGGLSSQVAGAGLQADYNFSPNFSNSLSYVYFSSFDESNLFKDEWNKIPANRIHYKLMIRVNNGFSIRGLVRYLSETRWLNFRNVSVQSNEKYKHILNEKLLVDLSLQKSFWQEKVWISILFKNIFNQEEIYHPVGVNLGLRFYLQVRLKFDNLFE